jgi:hypothetical protein
MKTPSLQQALPALGKADIATLKAQHQQWIVYTQRMAQLTPEQALADQATALQAFLASPTLENEQRLAVVADERLTRQRYRVLHNAYQELASRAKARAVVVISHHLGQLLESARQGFRHRQEEVLKLGHSRLLDEPSAEMRQWIDDLEGLLRMLHETAFHPDDWPGELLRWAESMAPDNLVAQRS